jgi:hypothetical protein
LLLLTTLLRTFSYIETSSATNKGDVVAVVLVFDEPKTFDVAIVVVDDDDDETALTRLETIALLLLLLLFFGESRKR